MKKLISLTLLLALLLGLPALPWNADDLPRFDEDFLAQAKAQYEQSR